MKFLELEKLLVEWFWTMYDENICVRDGSIREKAKRIIDELNQRQAEHEKWKLILVTVGCTNSENGTPFKEIVYLMHLVMFTLKELLMS